ncbi:MAG: RpiB/LacA/LacB family sugar-phosphate isomerase [Clostridiales Family XIII bacterium]|nr:RpiB/LacA/LacB family sugar-phosphate isomerase [Clostridiales Family XIII bacterium]
MKIAIGSDVSGYSLKTALIGHLEEKGIEYKDFGTPNLDSPDEYYDVVPAVVPLIQSGEYDYGVLLCGTGMGMSQVANSYKGIRAACVESVYAAKMCRAINDSNILCMGGFIVAPEMGKEMLDVFLSTQLTEGLDSFHDFLLDAQLQIKDLEARIY